MDMLFEEINHEKKIRLHFHRFMQNLHESLKQHEGTDPLKKIVKDLSKMFENTKKDEWNRSPPSDPTGQSKVIAVSFNFKKGGNVSVLCHDYAKHVDLPSGLDVTVRNKEFQQWLEKY